MSTHAENCVALVGPVTYSSVNTDADSSAINVSSAYNIINILPAEILRYIASFLKPRSSHLSSFAATCKYIWLTVDGSVILSGEDLLSVLQNTLTETNLDFFRHVRHLRLVGSRFSAEPSCDQQENVCYGGIRSDGINGSNETKKKHYDIPQPAPRATLMNYVCRSISITKLKYFAASNSYKLDILGRNFHTLQSLCVSGACRPHKFDPLSLCLLRILVGRQGDLAKSGDSTRYSTVERKIRLLHLSSFHIDQNAEPIYISNVESIICGCETDNHKLRCNSIVAGHFELQRFIFTFQESVTENFDADTLRKSRSLVVYRQEDGGGNKRLVNNMPLLRSFGPYLKTLSLSFVCSGIKPASILKAIKKIRRVPSDFRRIEDSNGNITDVARGDYGEHRYRQLECLSLNRILISDVPLVLNSIPMTKQLYICVTNYFRPAFPLLLKSLNSFLHEPSTIDTVCGQSRDSNDLQRVSESSLCSSSSDKYEAEHYEIVKTLRTWAVKANLACINLLKSASATMIWPTSILELHKTVNVAFQAAGFQQGTQTDCIPSLQKQLKYEGHDYSADMYRCKTDIRNMKAASVSNVNFTGVKRIAINAAMIENEGYRSHIWPILSINGFSLLNDGVTTSIDNERKQFRLSFLPYQVNYNFVCSFVGLVGLYCHRVCLTRVVMPTLSKFCSSLYNLACLFVHLVGLYDPPVCLTRVVMPTLSK